MADDEIDSEAAQPKMPTAREELEQPKMPTTREELDRAVRLTMSVKEESPLNFHQATICAHPPRPSRAPPAPQYARTAVRALPS